MSEIKRWVIPAPTVKKLAYISKEFSRLNTGAVGDEFWIIVADDTEGDYEGQGIAVGINKKGELVQADDSHCSCNYNFDEGMTPEKPQKLEGKLLVEFGLYHDFDDWLPELVATTNTLHKVLSGKRVNPKDVIALPNSEIRRAVVEIVGYDKIVKEANVLDESEDGKLLEIPLDDDENIVLVHVKDPSTDRQYFLRVPPKVKTAKEARAWTFGFAAEDFNPVQES